MKSFILNLVLICLTIGLISPAFARQSCGDENLNKWMACEKDTDCVLKVIPCAQLISINKKYLKPWKASQDCLSKVAGLCMPGIAEPNLENFHPICKTHGCLAKANK